MVKQHKQVKKKSNMALYIAVGVIIVLFAVFGFVFAKPHKQAGVQIQQAQTKTAQNDTRTSTSQNDTQTLNSDTQTDYKNFAKYKFSYKYKLAVSGHLNSLDFTVMIPQKEAGKQYFEKLKINKKPTKLYKENGNLKAEFSYSDIDNQDINLEISGIAYLRTYDIKTAKALKLKPSGTEDLSRYLKSEPLIESDDAEIIEIAQKIQGNTREEILDNMYQYIQNHMTYQRIKDIGAKAALKQGFGKCSEYAAIMTALCRAKNIPARVISGNFAREHDSQHTWVEVYYDDYGWVTYDPTFSPVRVTTRDEDGNVVKTEYRYETSHDNIHYIKSANDVFSSFVFHYRKPTGSNGGFSVTETINIRKL
ncbi:MAG: transglutaminase family protein [Candidatus Gastranaerophilales bacterium]|nr:transglutaminase family protein [Candidatus Gastranaerophilales bacterium]